MIDRRNIIKAIAGAPLIGAGVVSLARPAAIFAQDLTVKVGSKDFTEQFILGQMYIQVLQDMGVETEDKTNLGGTQIAQQALVNAEIDMYPEYTGTGLTEVLGLSVDEVTGGGATPIASPVADAAATPVIGGDPSQLVYDVVKTAYAEQFGLVWLERSPANNTQALAVTRAFSEEKSVTTVSQLAEIAGDLTISAPSDFPEREDGLLGLQRVYSAGFADMEVLPVTPGVKYQALLDGDADIVLAFGTDGQITGYDLILLEDDLGLWPPYNVAPVLRQEVLDAYPDVEERFNAVTSSLTDEILSGLNWQVDGDEKKEPADVATAYLTDNSFIGG